MNSCIRTPSNPAVWAVSFFRMLNLIPVRPASPLLKFSSTSLMDRAPTWIYRSWPVRVRTWMTGQYPQRSLLTKGSDIISNSVVLAVICDLSYSVPYLMRGWWVRNSSGVGSNTSSGSVRHTQIHFPTELGAGTAPMIKNGVWAFQN